MRKFIKVKESCQVQDSAELASTSKCGRTEQNCFNLSEDNFANSNSDFYNLIDKTNLNNCVTADKESLIIDLVENTKVKQILQNLSSNFTPPDNSHFNQVASTDAYEKLKNQIQLELKAVQFVAVTVEK